MSKTKNNRLKHNTKTKLQNEPIMRKKEIEESKNNSEHVPFDYKLPSLTGQKLIHKQNCKGFKMSRSPHKCIDKM